MRCLIFAGGDLQDPCWHINQIHQQDFLIAADSGAEHIVGLGFLPHLVVGDLDSISAETKKLLAVKGVPFKVSSGEKDETDTELALLEGIKLEPQEIIIFAGSGDRIDHMLANVFLLVGYLTKGIPLRIMTPTQTLQVIDKSITLMGYPKQVVSLLPLGQEVKGLTLRGFHYPLEQAVLCFGSPRGISNVMIGERAEIEFAEGVLLVVQNHLHS